MTRDGPAALAEGHESRRSGDLRAAHDLYLEAEGLYVGANDMQGAVRAWLDRMNVLYLTADTSERHARVRDKLVEVADAAWTIGAPDLRSEALVLAADCAYWSQRGADELEEAQMVTQLLNDVVDAWEAVSRHTAPVFLRQLGGITISTLRRLTRKHRVDAATIADPVGRRARLRQLVLLAAWWISVDAFAGEQQARLRARFAAALADLAATVDLGCPENLVARLRIAAEGADVDVDPEAWSTATRALTRHAWSVLGPEETERLVDQYYERAAPRTALHSRLARLAHAQRIDKLVGEDLARLVEADPPDTGRILALAERASARTLLDGVVEHLDVPDDDTCRELERRITAYPAPDQDDVRREMRLLSQLPLASTEDLVRLEERYAELGAGFTGAAEPLGLRDIQGLLSPAEVMVRYVLPARWSHPAYLPGVIVVSSDDAAYVRLPISDRDSGVIGTSAVDGQSPLDSAPLLDAVLETRLALSGRGDVRWDPVPQLQQLDRVLVEPVRNTGLTAGRSHWIVVPQRSLHSVPWMALQNPDGRWLIDEAAVTLSSSASVWATLRNRRISRDPPSLRQRKVCVLGDPLVAYAGMQQLPGALAEAEAVMKAWQSGGVATRVLLAEEATLRELRAAAPGSEVVHIAAHGSFPDDSALFGHSLLLSPDLDHSGALTADEVRRRLDLRGVQCVVLSVCDGGAYRLGPGDEPYGLVPALLEAGAESVVAAQWSVADESARTLMSRVGELLVGHTPAESLRRAVLERRDAGPDDWTHVAFAAIGS